jgi:hypothetical protein
MVLTLVIIVAALVCIGLAWRVLRWLLHVGLAVAVIVVILAATGHLHISQIGPQAHTVANHIWSALQTAWHWVKTKAKKPNTAQAVQ